MNLSRLRKMNTTQKSQEIFETYRTFKTPIPKSLVTTTGEMLVFPAQSCLSVFQAALR